MFRSSSFSFHPNCRSFFKLLYFSGFLEDLRQRRTRPAVKTRFFIVEELKKPCSGAHTYTWTQIHTTRTLAQEQVQRTWTVSLKERVLGREEERAGKVAPSSGPKTFHSHRRMKSHRSPLSHQPRENRGDGHTEQNEAKVILFNRDDRYSRLCIHVHMCTSLCLLQWTSVSRKTKPDGMTAMQRQCQERMCVSVEYVWMPVCVERTPKTPEALT